MRDRALAMMKDADAASPSVRRVRAAMATHGLRGEVRELPQSTRTAREAAAALGCTVAQIAKSIVFRRSDTGDAVLVVASGTNRVDEARVGAALGTTIGKADADFVRSATGYAIGGVPPFGHAHPVTTLIDRDLLALGTLWAAAGTPNAVFTLTADELVRATGGRVADVVAKP